MKPHCRQLAALTLAFGFLLGIRNGKVALWAEDSSHPEQIYDIREDTLPPADRLLLRQGIRLESREDVWQLLENYFD